MVEDLTGSSHDLVVFEFKPCLGLSAVSEKLTLDPLSPFLSAPQIGRASCRERVCLYV